MRSVSRQSKGGVRCSALKMKRGRADVSSVPSVLIVEDDPDMRDFRRISHLAMYSAVSFGAVAGRPSRPSITATGRGGAAALPRAPAAP